MWTSRRHYDVCDTSSISPTAYEAVPRYKLPSFNAHSAGSLSAGEHADSALQRRSKRSRTAFRCGRSSSVEQIGRARSLAHLPTGLDLLGELF